MRSLRLTLSLLVLLVFFAIAMLTAPRARAACTKDNYGKCGEQPPTTDRYDKKADKSKKGTAK